MAPKERKIYGPESVERGRRLLKATAIAVASVIALAYGTHLFRNYRKIEALLYRDEHQHLQPFSDDHTISKFGRIYSENRNANLGAGKLILVWTVETTDGRLWFCSYERGFSRFREGDPVRLIMHDNAGDEDDYTAFLVGIKAEQTGALSEVWHETQQHYKAK